MVIWLSLLIPVLAVIILAVFFHKNIAWWEYVLVFGIPFLLIIAFKFGSVAWQTNTKEWWNSYALEARYYEDWDEWVHRTCTRTVSCGKNCTRTVSYDCSHRVYHPAYWEIRDNIGGVYQVDKNYYYNLVQQWGNQKLQDLGRHYYTNDGDLYITKFDGVFDHSVPVCTQHTYENKVKCSKSIFNFQEVSKEDKKLFGLYDYPAHNGVLNYNPIKGWTDPTASLRLQRHNGQLGALKWVHMLILVFPKQPLQAGLMQEAYWKGSNMNEFVLCIGTDGGKKITWTKVISWTDVQILKVSLARKVKEMDTLNMLNVVDFMASEVKAKFIKKDFKDFDYIKVDPSDTAVIVTFIVTFLTTLGLSIFCALNRFDLDKERTPYTRRKYGR